MKSEIIKQAGFSSTFEQDRLEKLIELTVIETIKVLAEPKIVNQCVSTTFDASIAGCIIEKVTEEICKKFEIKRPRDIRYEPIVGGKV